MGSNDEMTSDSKIEVFDLESVNVQPSDAFESAYNVV